MLPGSRESEIWMQTPTAEAPMTIQSFSVYPLCFIWGLSLISFRTLGPETLKDVVLALRKTPVFVLGKKTCMCETTANWLGMKIDLW